MSAAFPEGRPPPYRFEFTARSARLARARFGSVPPPDCVRVGFGLLDVRCRGWHLRTPLANVVAADRTGDGRAVCIWLGRPALADRVGWAARVSVTTTTITVEARDPEGLVRWLRSRPTEPRNEDR